MSQGRGRLGALRLGRVLVWLVYAFFVLAVVILTITFFLLLFNASTSAPFTQWMYRSASRLLQPFRGIFPSAEAGNGSIFDAATLFAILMYGLFAMFVHWIVTLLDDRVYALRDRAARAESARAVPMPAATAPSPYAAAAQAPPAPQAAPAPQAPPAPTAPQAPPAPYEWPQPPTG